MLENESIILSSVGLFSSWCLNKPFRTLFDCGDGCAQTLKKRIFVPERILFSHGHIDHVAGLLSFVGLRNKTMGANDKALELWYPKGDSIFQTYIRMLNEIIPHRYRKFEITWREVQAGDEIPIGNKTYVKCFKTNHTPWSLGYVIRQESTRVKEGVDKATVGVRLKSGEVKKEDVLERHDCNLFAYTLDNAGFDIEEVRGVKEIVLDATFLDAADRDAITHATLDEAKTLARLAGVGLAYLAHISPRYKRSEEVVFRP